MKLHLSVCFRLTAQHEDSLAYASSRPILRTRSYFSGIVIQARRLQLFPTRRVRSGRLRYPIYSCLSIPRKSLTPAFLRSNSVKQFATFISKTVAKRVELGQRSSVEHEGYHVHVHVRSNGLASVAVCDKEYPSRVAFTLLMKMQEDFINAHSEAKWMSTANELGFAPLDDMITKYQDPHEADAIMRIQKDLDETKIILHKTIDSVLERGVKLDNLVEKSTDLSAQSKMYVSSCIPRCGTTPYCYMPCSNLSQF